MNGRIYDQMLGRFLSADRKVDGITTVQGFNRYSYVHNNPLTHIDKTGYGKSKAVGAIVKLAESAVMPRTVRQKLTHKALANAYEAGGKQIMVKSARDARKVANILEGRGAKAFFTHDGHAIKDASGKVIGTGMKHIQSDSFKGQHIFYASVAALITANVMPESKADSEQRINNSAVDSKLFEGVSSELSDIYSNEYPGRSELGHAFTISSRVGKDNPVRHLDWINPLELLAVAGDIGRAIDREIGKELLGFALTTYTGDGDNRTAQNTFTFNMEGFLESVSTWADGAIVETISGEEYFKRAEEERLRLEQEDQNR
jgi:hypothetical protein